MAVIWHQTGMVYEEAGRVEAAEQAYRHALQENKTEEMAARLTELSKQTGLPAYLKALIAKLQAILAGSRDAELAADPELYYRDAAEVLFLLETLG